MDQELHLKDYLRVIAERRYVVILFFMATLIVTIVNTMTAIPLYKGTTVLFVEKNELNKIVSPLSQARFFYDDEENFLNSQKQIINSHEVAEKVKQKLKREVEGRASANKAGKEKTGEVDPEKRMIEIVATIESHQISSTTKVETDLESNTILISYISRSALLAATAANFVADAYVEQNFDIGSKTAKSSQTWMNRKVEDALRKLEESEKRLQGYMKENDILTVENKITILPQKLAQLSTRLTMAEAERKEKEAVYQGIKDLPEDMTDADTIPVIANDRFMQEIQDQIMKAEQEIMRLSNKYGDKHPVMIRAANNLEILRDKKKQLIVKLIKYETNQYELAKATEENLKNLFLSTKEEVVLLNDKIVGYEIMKKDVESNRDVYESLINKLKEQYLIEDVPPVTVRVIEKAVPPLKPFSPRKKRNIMMGLIIGLFGGIGLAFFMNYLDQTIKSPYDLAKRVEIPVLATIPFHSAKEMRIEEVVLNEPLSSIAEAYKAIRMFIFFSARKKIANTILVTSGVHGDGKTATAINLAVAIAQSDARVLLIDADLREPRIHEILDLENSRGLSTLLSGVSGSKGGSLKRGPIDKMQVITAGPKPDNPSELIGSIKMSMLLKKLESHFDYIIFDSPVIGVTDSLMLARYSDGTIVVTRSGKTTYNRLETELNSLKNVNANVFGLVINGVHQG